MSPAGTSSRPSSHPPFNEGAAHNAAPSRFGAPSLDDMPDDIRAICEETRAKMIETIRAQINPYLAAGWAMIDDVIEPADTRRVIFRGLEQARDKRVERPWRKHGNIPV